MAINQFVKPTSPLEAIASALKVAESVYGIKNAASLADKLTRENKSGAEAADPTSDYSKTRQEAAGLGLSALVKKGTIDASAAGPLLQQIRGASGASIDKLQETSPLFQMAKQDGLIALAGARMATGQEKNQLSANKDYAKELGPYERTIQASNRVDELINKVKSGDLKSTKTFRNDLNSAVGMMFNNGKSATVYGMSHADQQSLFGSLQAQKDRIMGTASDTIPTEQLDQLQKDVHALRAEYVDAHEQTYNSFKEGLPDRLKVKTDARFNQFRQSMAAKIGKNSSPALGGGGVPGVSSANASEVQQPAQGPSVIQNAALNILKQRRAK